MAAIRTLPITAIVASSGTRQCLFQTLAKILECNPSPAEVLVHLDDPPNGVEDVLERQFPDVIVLVSRVTTGPGGGRQLLIGAASNELIASFDDDSYPETDDFFLRVSAIASRFPEPAVFSAASSLKEKQTAGCMVISVYSGCGCVFRKSWMRKIEGFVPLRIAYGMEEADVSLQLHAVGGAILHVPDLHVRHDHPTDEHRDVNLWHATTLANTMLLAWLRYPIWLIPLGVIQVFSRILWMFSNHHLLASVQGVRMLPSYLWRYRHFRKEVEGKRVISWLLSKRHSLLVSGKRTEAQ